MSPNLFFSFSFVAIRFALNILRPAGQNDLVLFFGHLSSILLLPVCFQLCQN